MSDESLPVKIDPGVLNLIHSSFNQSGALQPFAREILLIECHIAGTGYVDIKSVEAELQKDTLLVLRREPKNEHDPLAIQILDEKGRKLGWVPQAKNEALARLMDAGKFLFAKLVGKEWHHNWLRIEAQVYLRDL